MSCSHAAASSRSASAPRTAARLRTPLIADTTADTGRWSAVALSGGVTVGCCPGAVLRDGGLADGPHRPAQGPGGGFSLGQLCSGRSEAREAICGGGHLDRDDLAAARRSHL